MKSNNIFKKNLILLIIFLLFSTSVLAQDFNINIIKYNPETQNVRLRIENTASTDFHDVKINIDNAVEVPVNSFIGSGSIISIFLVIPPGEHEITITTKEGITETKKLYFSPTEEQLKEIIANKKEIREQQKQLEKPKEDSAKKIKYIYILIALIIILIISWLYKRFKSQQIRPNNLKTYKK